MAPMVASQPRTIIISPSKLSLLNGNENSGILENAELPKYAVGLFESNGPGPRKRKRLTHLTPEEKIMRRKLKNRVAAQTARDRKKARLETLEETVAKIHEQTKKLLDVNSQLIERTEALEKENQILRQRLGLKGDCSFTQNQMCQLETIKKEFNDIILPEDVSHQNMAESSDEEYMLTQCDSDDVSSDGVVFAGDSMCRVSECGSPVPAAGSCQAREADPLTINAQAIIGTDHTVAKGSSPCEGEHDLARILKDIAENFEANKSSDAASNSEEGDAVGSPEVVIVPGDLSCNRITVPLNVFGDHEYFKPEPCIRLCQGDMLTKVPCAVEPVAAQTSFQITNDSKKSPALVEESGQQDGQYVSTQVADEIQRTDSAFLGAELEDKDIAVLPDPLLDVCNLDSIFENLFADTSCKGALSDSDSDALSTSSDSASCASPDPGFLNTPSPLSDTVDPFELSDMSSFWEDPFAADLFPQLAAV